MASRLKQAFILYFAVCIPVEPLYALQLPSKPPSSLRRRLVEGAVLAGSSCLLPRDAVAYKGAAEYDLEYYMRDLFGGNAREGNVLPSKPPPIKPPRTLKGPLLPLLLNDDCDATCVPTRALLELTKSDETIIRQKMNDYRTRASRSFAARAPWNEEHVTDQYYFDLTAYALWKTAADLFDKDYEQRDVFARSVGRGIYKQASMIERTESNNLTDTIPAATDIMNLFSSSNYCTGYRLGEKGQTALFDELDNNDLASGATVNCLVSVYEPASLGASLQITGEQSRFIPEFVGATLAALWEEAGMKVSYETYFVDNEYRPNPKDYFPNEQLLQFSLSLK